MDQAPPVRSNQANGAWGLACIRVRSWRCRCSTRLNWRWQNLQGATHVRGLPRPMLKPVSVSPEQLANPGLLAGWLAGWL